MELFQCLVGHEQDHDVLGLSADLKPDRPGGEVVVSSGLFVDPQCPFSVFAADDETRFYDAGHHQHPFGLGGQIFSTRDLLVEPAETCIDVVVDLVAGPKWPELLDVLRRGGRYAVAGAIAGPLVELDVRTLYLKDLTFFGCTYQERVVFENLVSYVDRGEIKPMVSKTYPLSDIHEAQEDFIAKKFTGKLVLIPPAVN